MSSINEQTRYQWTLRDEKRVIRLKFYTRNNPGTENTIDLAFFLLLLIKELEQ